MLEKVLPEAGLGDRYNQGEFGLSRLNGFELREKVRLA